MPIRLFDVFAGCGGTGRGDADAVDPADLSADMEAFSIGGALVRISPVEMDASPTLSNTRLYALCQSFEGFTPCPVVVPNICDDFPSEAEQAGAAIAAGAGAVVIRPNNDGWSLVEWCSGPLFAALEERRLPVFCSFGQVDYNTLAELAGRYPDLPFILAGLAYRDQRIQVPLLKRFPNIYLSIGERYCVHHGLEHFAAEVGAERILFGTGWPVTEPMAAVTYLMYSALSDGDKQLVGAGNMERLIGGIIHG